MNQPVVQRAKRILFAKDITTIYHFIEKIGLLNTEHKYCL